ncbi:MAG: autotransporter-associated beta strand repeat-containing protein [Verrucomicrobiales bacterium]|nr:autotransporter-associated beta strand repeat-containing protein [Verrucomicrobiales bacterium]
MKRFRLRTLPFLCSPSLNQRLSTWLTAATLGAASLASAATGTWTLNGSGNWSDVANWSGGTVPGLTAGGNDVANINNNIGNNNSTITIDGALPTPNTVFLGTLRYGDNNRDRNFIISGGTINFSTDATAGTGDSLRAMIVSDLATSPYYIGSSSDRIDSALELDDADGFTIDRFANLTLNGTINGSANFGGDIEVKGQGLVLQQAELTGSVTSLTINDGEWRLNSSSTVGRPTSLGSVTQVNIGDGMTTVAGDRRVWDTLSIIDPLGAAGTAGIVHTQNFTLNQGRLWVRNTNSVNGGADTVASGLSTSPGSNSNHLTGTIQVTGTEMNLLQTDRNDGGSAEATTIFIEGPVTGSGNLAVIGSATTIFSADNTFAGVLTVLDQADDSSSNVGKVNLLGTNGAFSAVSEIRLERRATLFLDDTQGLHSSGDRINDAAQITFMDGQTRIEVMGNSSSATSETLGAVVLNGGNGAIELDLDDTTPQDLNLTVASITRNAPSVLELRIEDNASGTGYTDHFHLSLAGAGGISNVPVVGSTVLANGSAMNSNVLLGVYAGERNNSANHFLTLDADGTTVRILDPVTEMRKSTSVTGTARLFDIDGSGSYTDLTQANVFDSAYTATDENVTWNYTPTSPDNSVTDGDAFVVTDQTFNAMRVGFQAGGNDRGRTLNLINDATLTLTSGQILMGRPDGGDSSAAVGTTRISGGTVDFGTAEGVIQNASGSTLYIYSALSGSGGLTKGGGNSVVLSGDNSALSGTLTILDGIVYAEGSKSLDGFTQVITTGDGVLYLQDGISTPAGMNIATSVSNTSTTFLRGDAGLTEFNGDIQINQVDSVGLVRGFQNRVTVNTNSTLNLNGDVYRTAASLAAQSTDLNVEDPVRWSFDGSSSGVVNINGQVSDSLGGPSFTTGTSATRIDSGSSGLASQRGADENFALVTEIEGNNELNVNVRQQWNAVGRVELVQGILRVEVGENTNFWTDAARDASDFGNGFGGFSMAGGASANETAALLLTQDGQRFNAKQWTVNSGPTSGAGLRDTLAIIGGGNETGTVYFGGIDLDRGSGSSNRITSNRALTLYQMEGGTMVVNQSINDGAAGDDYGMLVAIGGGTKVVQQYRGAGANGGTSDSEDNQIDRGAWVRGGTLQFNYDNGTTNSTLRNLMSPEAGMHFNGGNVEVMGDATTAGTKGHTGLASNGTLGATGFSVQSGGSELAVVTQGADFTLNLGSATTVLTRNAGGTLNVVEENGSGIAAITFQAAGVTAGSAAGVYDSFLSGASTYGTQRGGADGWLGLDDTYNVGLFSGTTDDVYSSGTHTSVTVDPASAGYTTASVLLGVPLASYTDSGAGVIETGGLLKTTASTGDTTITGGGTLTSGAGNELILQNFSSGNLIVDSVITDNGSAVDLTITTPNDGVAGFVVLNGTNTHTGTNYINGGVDITTGGDAAFGAVPGAATSNLIVNGGTIRTTASQTIADNRLFVVGGDGATFDVGTGATLQLAGTSSAAVDVLQADSNVFDNIDLPRNDFSGDLVKTGAGILAIGVNSDGEAGLQNSYAGLTDVREGTLRFSGRPADADPDTIAPLGTTVGWEDGTIVRGGATLDLQINYGGSGFRNTQNIYEWLTLEDGSTLMKGDNTLQFRGQVRVDGEVTFDVGRREMVFTDGGVLQSRDPSTLDTLIITQSINNNDGNFRINESNPELNAQWVVVDGTLEFASQGAPEGIGTAPILLGRTDLGGPGSGLAGSGNNDEVGLYLRGEADFPVVRELNMDVVLRDEGGLNNQLKRIGVRFPTNNDVYNFNGDIVIDDMSAVPLRVVGRDESTSDSNGDPNGNEIVFMNFNGQITGANSDATIEFRTEQGGTPNLQNGTSEVNVVTVISLNGDNRSTWNGNLDIGLTEGTSAFSQGAAGVGDNDKTTIVRINEVATDADNDVVLRYNSRLQVNGSDAVIGNIFADADGTTDTPVGIIPAEAYIENGADIPVGGTPNPGSLTINQTTDHVLNALIRDGQPIQLDPAQAPASMSIVKEGSGALTYVMLNEYTGTTDVNAGVLQVGLGGDGTFAVSPATTTSADVVGRTGTGLTTVNTGGRLAGTGHVQGDLLLAGGSLTPGDDSAGVSTIGTLFVGNAATSTGDFTMSSGEVTFQVQAATANNTDVMAGTYNWQTPGYESTNIESVILGTSGAAPTAVDPGSGGFGLTSTAISSTQHDHLEIGNDLTWTGGTIKVEFAGGYTPQAGDVFNLVDWYGSANWGGFNTGGALLVGNGDDSGDLELPDLSADPSLRWDTRYLESSGVLFIVAPEPSRLLLAAFGLLAIALRRRRK